MKEKNLHPRWEEDGRSLEVVKNNPSEEEVRELKNASIEAIKNSYNSETNEEFKRKSKE